MIVAGQCDLPPENLLQGLTKTYWIDGESKIRELSHVDAERTIVEGSAGIKQLMTLGKNTGK